MEFIQKLVQNKSFQRVLTFVLLVGILYLLRSEINLILLTFIFAFIVNRLEGVVLRWVKVPRKLIVIILYILVALGIYAGITHLLPVLIKQVSELVDIGVKLYKHPPQNGFMTWLMDTTKNSHIQSYLRRGADFIMDSLKSFGALGMSFFLALILSFFFSLEKERVIKFTAQFQTSKLSFLYNNLTYFGRKFVSTFGVVLEAQLLIAFINTLITSFALYLMHFPQLLSLIIMVFLFGLIPVAGVIISCIPLTVIAYSIGGVEDVIYLLITIVIVHCIETYFLNPKLMSSKTSLPIFYTFIVLILSESYFGVWGLIVGIPAFVFMLDILDVRSEEQKQEHTFLGKRKKHKI